MVNKYDMIRRRQRVYGWAKGKGFAVLNHKPTKVLRLSTTNRACGVCIRSWLLAKDSEVRGEPPQLGRTYRRRTLRRTKTAWKATGNHPGKYV